MGSTRPDTYKDSNTAAEAVAADIRTRSVAEAEADLGMRLMPAAAPPVETPG